MKLKLKYEEALALQGVLSVMGVYALEDLGVENPEEVSEHLFKVYLKLSRKLEDR